MKFDQIAIVADIDFRLKSVYDGLMLNTTKWFKDCVEAKGVIWRNGFKKVENRAVLMFNYDIIPGKEFELIAYVDGENFLEWVPPGMVSHMAAHVINIDNNRAVLQLKGWRLIQEVVTQSHTSKKVAENRRYHYAIYEHPAIDYRLKLIERTDIHHADQVLEKVYDLL